MTGKMTRTCTIDGCDKPHLSRGWCAMHYRRWKKHGDPLVRVLPERSDTCSVDGCDGRHEARGWCRKHLSRWRRHGDPTHTVGRDRDLPTPICDVADCDRLITDGGRGLCTMHYQRWRKHGSTDLPERTLVKDEPCDVDGCDRPRCTRQGYCQMHLHRFNAHGDPTKLVHPWQRSAGEQSPTCTAEGCDKPTAARDLCSTHYAAWHRNSPAYRERALLLDRLHQAKRRALTVPSPFSPEELDGRLSVFGGRCYICGTDDAGEVEHVKPLSRGGMHSLANLRPACRSCNAHKSATWPVDTSTVAVRLDPTRLP